MATSLRPTIFPRPTRSSLTRILLTVIVCFVFFRYLLIPVWVDGRSMEPTISDKSLHFCWRLHYLFSAPQRFDIVTIRLAGDRVMLLKRIIGLPGETVGFRNGTLIINGRALEEPHVVFPSSWNLEPKTVLPGKYFVVGDNRSVDIQTHRFGQVEATRILGGLLW